jgi:predicted nucleic acid-binding protein
MAFIYADSCIIIYLLEGDFSRRERIAEYLLRSDDASNRIAFSDLTRMECLIHPVREGNTQLRSAYEAFFSGPCSDYIPLTSEVFDKATELRAEYSLKTPDAIHLAAALVSGCDVFLTNDLRLNRVDVGTSIEVLPF